MTTAIQIADWLVMYRAEVVGAPIDAMSLEKHLFYGQGFHLAVNRAPLFNETIEAWRDGPVVPAVWRRYHNYGGRPIMEPDANPGSVSFNTQLFLADLVVFLSSHTAPELSLATHAEEPWINARKPFSRFDPSNVPLDSDQLLTYFSKLISEGEDALSRHALFDTLPEPRWGWAYVAGICSRRMTKHPFFKSGTAQWREKLWTAPANAEAPLAKMEMKPPRRRDAPPSARFSSIREYEELRRRERLDAAE